MCACLRCGVCVLSQLVGGPSRSTFDAFTNNVCVDLASATEASDTGDSFSNIVHQLVWTLSLCRPQPVLRPEVLVYVCKMYGAWAPAMTMLQEHALSITDELTPIRVQVRAW